MSFCLGLRCLAYLSLCQRIMDAWLYIALANASFSALFLKLFVVVFRYFNISCSPTREIQGKGSWGHNGKKKKTGRKRAQRERGRGDCSPRRKVLQTEQVRSYPRNTHCCKCKHQVLEHTWINPQEASKNCMLNNSTDNWGSSDENPSFAGSVKLVC